MFTVCPKCTLTLAVTAADLRIGQGYVRCGRCLNVFNALLTLSDEPADNSAPAPQYSQADPASRSQITAALASSAAAAAQEVEIPPERPAHASPADGPPNQLPTESSSDGSIENESSLADGTGTFETIVLEGDGFTQTEEFVPGESVDSELAALTQRLGAAANEPIAVPVDWRSKGAAPASFQDVAAEILGAGSAAAAGSADPADAAASAPALQFAAASAAGRQRWRWIAGCSALGVLLALQAVNHWRDALAASPLWNAPLSRIYAALRVPLDPHWDLAAYDIRQQGAQSEPGDSHVILVRLSLANHAARAQPVPLLRLTLLDRFGKRLAWRDLTPAEYWPKGHAVRTFLAPDERIDSQVAVRDPGADSASFELDVCLRNARGAVHCAGDGAPTAGIAAS